MIHHYRTVTRIDADESLLERRRFCGPNVRHAHHIASNVNPRTHTPAARGMRGTAMNHGMITRDRRLIGKLTHMAMTPIRW